MQPFQMRPLGFGEVLDGAFQIFRRHFVVLGATALIPFLFTIVVVAVGVAGALGAGAADAAPLLLVLVIPLYLLVMTSFVVAWGALAWQTSEAWLGGTVSIGDGLRMGLRATMRLLGTGVLVFLIAMVAFFGAAMAAGLLAAVGAAAGTAVMVVLMVLLAVGCLVAYVAAMGALSPALPAVVVEGLRPMRAVGRSFELGRGAYLRTGLLFLVATMIVMMPSLALMYLTGQFENFGNPAAPQPSMAMIAVQQVLSLAWNTFTTPFMAAVITVAYYDRRVRTEALDVQLAANQLQGTPEPV